MKTSELRERIRKLYYFTAENEAFTDALTIHGAMCARAYTKSSHVILNTDNMNLAKLVIEYAETPINERDDEKKYTVILPDSQRRGKRVMALGKLSEYDNEVIILHIKKETLDTERCRLTEAEIKRNHEYLWQFAKEVAE